MHNDHPLVAVVCREGRSFTEAETRTILLDAFRPLATYLESFVSMQRMTDAEESEMALALVDAIPLAHRAREVADSLGKSPGTSERPEGLPELIGPDLLVTVALALEVCAGKPKRLGEAQYIACTVADAYRTLLRIEVEEALHV